MHWIDVNKDVDDDGNDDDDGDDDDDERGKRRGFLRGTSSAGHQWPAIAMVGGETGNPIYTFLPNNQPTLAICKTIYTASDRQALQEHAYNPQCGQNSQNTRCGQKSQQRVVFRTRASRSCGKTYNLCIYAHSEHMWSKYENLLDLLWRTTGVGMKKHFYIFLVESCSMLKESWQRASCRLYFCILLISPSYKCYHCPKILHMTSLGIFI